MADRIKSFVRIRPQLPTDAADRIALKPVADDKVHVELPNEPDRSCSRVFNDVLKNDSIWELAGRPAVEAMLRGEMATIVVAGQSGSGKTYTCIGENDDGLVGNTIKALTGNEEANLCVLHFHGDTIQDLVSGADNLKMKYDEQTGASCDNGTTVRLPTSTGGLEHVGKCLAKQKELIESAKTATALCGTVYAFAAGDGRLNIIDCYAMDRIWKASTTAEERKLVDEKNKIMVKVQQCWQESAVNADPKAIGWKDVKITRFFQTGLSQAMEGPKGFAALITCVFSNAAHAYESASSVFFAERAMKQEGLQSVSVYKEMIQNIEDQIDLNSKEEPRLKGDAQQAEQAALKVKKDNEAKLAELAEKESLLEVRVQQARQQVDKELEQLLKDQEKRKQDLEKKNQEELERMRNLSKNAPQQAEIDTKKKIAEVEAEHKEKMESMSEELQKKKEEIAENKELIAELKELKEEHEKEEAHALKPVRALEKQLAELEKQAAKAGQSREEGLTEEELKEKKELWEARDELDDLEDEIQRIALECMALEHGFANGVGKPVMTESESTDSETDTTDSDTETSTEFTTSNEDSDSDSDSDESTDTEDERERAKRVRAELKAAKAEEARMKVDRKLYDAELAHFRETVNKDTFLAELLEKIVLYLEYGTNVTILRDDGNFARHFLYLSNRRTMMCFGAEAVDTNSVTKDTPLMAFPMAGVHSIVMGQHSRKFQKELKKIAGRVDPPRNEQPPGLEELSTKSLHRYYYRSLTLELSRDKNGEEQTIDLICDTQTDFEAMVVAYHRQTLKEASWGRKLYIDFCEKVDDLEPFEREFCETHHLTPEHYLFCKQRILDTDERLYITLHDIRLISGLDLFHSQRMMELWTKQRWIVRRQVNYFKYQDKLQASAQRHADPSAGVDGAPGSFPAGMAEML